MKSKEEKPKQHHKQLFNYSPKGDSIDKMNVTPQFNVKKKNIMTGEYEHKKKEFKVLY